MPTIQIANPLGAALGTVSSLAGGYAQGQMAQQRMALMQQELEARKKREAAYAQALEAEQEDRDRERRRQDELRAALANAWAAQYGGDVEMGSTPTAPKQDIPEGPRTGSWDFYPQAQAPQQAAGDDFSKGVAQRRQRAMETVRRLAPQIAAKGGDPSKWVESYMGGVAERESMALRRQIKNDLGKDIEMGGFGGIDPSTGANMDPEKDPWLAQAQDLLLLADDPKVSNEELVGKSMALRQQVAAQRREGLQRVAVVQGVQRILQENPNNSAAIDAQANPPDWATWQKTRDQIARNVKTVQIGDKEIELPFDTADQTAEYLNGLVVRAMEKSAIAEAILAQNKPAEQSARIATEEAQAKQVEARTKQIEAGEAPTDTSIKDRMAARKQALSELKQAGIEATEANIEERADSIYRRNRGEAPAPWITKFDTATPDGLRSAAEEAKKRGIPRAQFEKMLLDQKFQSWKPKSAQ